MNKTLPIIHKAPALDIGSLAHNGLEVYYRMLAENEHFDERVSACVTKIKELSTDVSEYISDTDKVTHLCGVIEENLDYWRSEDESSLEILQVEQPFAYTLFEDDTVRFIISGKIDLLVNFHGIGRNASYSGLPIDHKTFSRDSEVLRKSNQFINYCNAVESNYLVVNRIGLTQKKAEEKFKRLPLSYDPLYIKAWKDNLIKMLGNEYLTCIATGSWVEKPTSCNKFNRTCEYYIICDSSGQDAKDFKLENEFIDAPEWDVTKDMENK
jgi:hypothetical protein